MPSRWHWPGGSPQGMLIFKARGGMIPPVVTKVNQLIAFNAGACRKQIFVGYVAGV